MLKIRKNDTVQVIKGRDAGKRGRVLNVFAGNKVLVEGINVVKKHKRQTRQDQTGGIISIELPVSYSNVMLVCKSCNKPARVGFSQTKGDAKARICKSCKEAV